MNDEDGAKRTLSEAAALASVDLICLFAEGARPRRCASCAPTC